MGEVGKLAKGPPSEAWAKSLRRETALQDHYRRAIHHGDGSVSNIGFDRWNAARRLQEQIDSARGVEHTRRLVKSRAITARFTRRSVMKDLPGTELQVTPDVNSNAGGGASLVEGSLTRGQALERFGIDLSRVGVMTSARTASRQSLEGIPAATGSTRNADQTGNNQTGSERGRGLTTGDSKRSSKAAVSDKLQLLDILLSDDADRPLPTERGEKNNEEEARAIAQLEEGGHIGVSEGDGTRNNAAAHLRAGGSDMGVVEGRLRSSLVQETQSPTLVEKKSARSAQESQVPVPVPVPKQVPTVTDIHVPHGKRAGRAARCSAKEAGEIPAKEKGPAKEATNICGKALPNHRPCWWWASLLSPGVEDVSIPDMIFLAPAEVLPDQNNERMPSSSPNTAATARSSGNTKPPSSKSSVSQQRQQTLIWAFSKAQEQEGGGEGDAKFTATPNPRVGVATLVEGGGGTSPSSVEKHRPRGKFGFSKENHTPVPKPRVRQLLHTKVVDAKEELLCAARAICECGRRGGGGGGTCNMDGNGGEKGFKLKLPLAVLKVWGRENEEERRRKVETSYRGRRLRVVSLWTENEVLRALRDMIGGRLCRPTHHKNARAMNSDGSNTAQNKTGFVEGDEDTCCVQAFTRSTRFADATTSHPFVLPFDGSDQNRLPPFALADGSLAVPRSSKGIAAMGGDGLDGKSVGTSSSDGGTVGILNTRIGGGNHDQRGQGATTLGDRRLAGPVFYRVAWRRTGERIIVWRITSRYPYFSSLSAHFCPLVRVGSMFTASRAEDGAVAMVTAKMENLAKALRRAYDPTLQRLWADWAINEGDGRWLLVEVHGMKNDAAVLKAAAARAVPPDFSDVESKVRNSIHLIPPKHYCGDPDDLKARISAANPTQELSLVEISKRVAAAESKRRPGRPPTPSKVAETTKKALLSQRKAAPDREPSGKNGRGARQIRNQYWRCAGDFCETLSATARTSARGLEVASRGAAEEEGSDRGGECEVEDIIGRRKHALAVEMPRTVLFRLVLNARAALLGWRPSAFEFSQMEKPVQLCSACYMVCNTLDRDRIETTRRAMEAADHAAREGKARQNRRPPGWKSRVQNELEDALGADRHVVSRLIHSFEAASAGTVRSKKNKVSRAGLSISNSAQSTPRERVSFPAAAGARSKTAPLVSNRSSMLGQRAKHKKTPSLRGAGTKQQQDEEGQKQLQQQKDRERREMRARRKAKERARRRLRNIATDDAGAAKRENAPSEKKGQSVDDPSEHGGGAGEIDDRLGVEQNELPPPLLRPTAPGTLLPDSEVPDQALTRGAPSAEIGEHERDSWGSENEHEALGRQGGSQERPIFAIKNVDSEYSEEEFEDDAQQHHFLQPIAPREEPGKTEEDSQGGKGKM